MGMTLEETVQLLKTNDMDSFTTDLEIARQMWRLHRDLVEAPRWPEPFRAYAIKRHGLKNPEREDFWPVSEYRVTEPDYQQQLLEEAQELMGNRQQAEQPKRKGI